jgi:alpha-mannosidase
MNRLFNRLLTLVVAVAVLLVAYVRSAEDDLSTMKALKGYVKAIAGEQLAYNCFNPIAGTALLTRCTTGEMAIEWETEPVPADAKGDAIFFKWIVSYSTMTSGGDRHFDFFINGQKTFVIATQRGVSPQGWTLKASDGSELTFQLVKEDAARDANGYMLLKVPAARFKKGDPLRLRVVGEKASSNDWFMTFMYDLREVEVEVLAAPFLTKKDGAFLQTVCVAVSYLREKGNAVISIDNGNEESRILSRGVNVLEIPIPAVGEPKTMAVHASVDGASVQAFTLTVRPVPRRTIYLLPHSHNDIGYTDIQTNVLKKQVKNIYDALDLIKKTASYPPEARFKWNVEVLWGLEAFLKEASEAKRAELLEAVKQGSMNVEGLYLNMLTGLMRPEEFYRLTGFARSLKHQYGINVTTAMISDVPGMTWNMVPTLADAGIKYFSSGPNGPYTGGDRTGHTNRAWADRPFYWVSPSGDARILYWMAGFGYGSFFAGLSAQNANRIGFLRSFSRYFEWLDEISYPYDMLYMRHTINGDNGTVDPDLPQYVKTWNEKYVSPKIVIATTRAAFSEFEKKYADVIPAFNGDFTPYWEDGAASSAYELGLNRTAAEHLVQSEALCAMLAPAKYDDKKYYEAWKSVLLFNEHTWGAFNSTTEPDSPFVSKQWEIKQRFAIDAARFSAELRKAILAPPTGPKASNVFEVLNTNSWMRTDLVVLPKAESGAGDLVKDEKGREVPSQRLSNGDLAFLARDVPPLGGKHFTVQAGKTSFKSRLRIEGATLSDDNLEVTLDKETGAIISLKTLVPSMEYVDTTRSGGLNQYLYVPGIDPREAVRSRKASIVALERGPLVASFVVTSEAPGCKGLKSEVRLISGMGRVDLLNTIDKEKVRKNEAVHFGFPFAVPGAITRIDLGYGVIRPEADQLPGACKDYFSAQRWADVSNQQCGVTLTVLEAPLIEVGEMHSELPSPHRVDWKWSQPSSSWLGSYVMNNYWYTNYKADQEGVISYHYSILPHGLFNQNTAAHAGIERSQPLIVRHVAADAPVPASLFAVTPSSVIATYVKPLGSGSGYLVRLFNAGGSPETARLTFGSGTPSVYRSSPFEERGEKVNEISLPANAVVTVRIEGGSANEKSPK